MAASLKLAAVALILALLIATAAALWDAEGRRTDESLYAAFADALPEPLLAGLEKDVSVHAKIANRQLMHNKSKLPCRGCSCTRTARTASNTRDTLLLLLLLLLLALHPHRCLPRLASSANQRTLFSSFQ